MTKPKPKPETAPKPAPKKPLIRPAYDKVYEFITQAKRELSMPEIRINDVTMSTVEHQLRQLCIDGSIVRRQVRPKGKQDGRAFWVYRLAEANTSLKYEDVVTNKREVPAPKKKGKEKNPEDMTYKEILATEPASHRVIRDLPKGQQQVVDELYLNGYYDPSHPNHLKDPRPMKKLISPEASGDVVQLLWDSGQLQKAVAASPPNWAEINSLAQSMLVHAASLMKESTYNIITMDKE
jgi:hypothetical protein